MTSMLHLSSTALIRRLRYRQGCAQKFSSDGQTTPTESKRCSPHASEGVCGTAVPRRAFIEPARSARSTDDVNRSAEFWNNYRLLSSNHFASAI
jgi:hypothetical protein